MLITTRRTMMALYFSFAVALLAFALVSGRLDAAASPAPTAQNQPSVTVQLAPVGGSGISGTATLIAAGDFAHAPNLDDATRVSLTVVGLPPLATAQSSLHAGTCVAPSASAAALPSLTADGAGRATATGMVLFRGEENVAFSSITGGDHVINISSGGRVVACGAIPGFAGGALRGDLLAQGERNQVIYFNPDAALQKRIFADGFVPNSGEFRMTAEGVQYIAQRAEHLGTGAVRVYYVRVGDWGNVQFVQR
jgi:hypothetical protein